MTSRNRNFAVVTLPICAAILVAGAWFTSGGDLNPPAGLVTGTMKTLVEVEPRVVINATNTPPGAASLFKITLPGSYYLTGNIQGVAAKHGIEIASSNVSVDLMGFALIGVAGSIDGVSATVNNSNTVRVANGTASGWGQSGVNLASSFIRSSIVENVAAHGNGTRGISIYNGVVRACVASGNAFAGISTTESATITGCTAMQNTGVGFLLGSNAVITGCSAAYNTGDGIQVTSTCHLLNNTCTSNGNVGDGAGIHATFNDNRIEGNICTFADRGLDIDGVNNYVSGNTVRGNTDNYDIVQGNQLNILLGQIPESIDWPAKVTLAGTLTGVAGQNGISITANDVTIDLGGHALIGVAGSLDGVSVTVAGLKNLAVVHGAVRNWGVDGVDMGTMSAVNCRVEGVLASGNTGNGILPGNGGTVSNCSASLNTGTGISTGVACTVSNCSASSNAGNGIGANNGCTVSNCSAFSNIVAGISTGGECTVTNCSAFLNVANGISAGSGGTITNCSASSNSGSGISVGSGSTVADCTARINTLDGIICSFGCVIRGNTCSFNGSGAGDGAGIHATASDNRIEGNNCTSADRGIDVDSGNNYISGNTVRSNTDNYDIAQGNQLNILLGQIPESIDWPAHVTLAGSLTGVSGQNGISITANDVTIDLSGHALIGVAGSLDGVVTTVAGLRNIAVVNGSVRNWGQDGVNLGDSNVVACRVEGIQAGGNVRTGVRAGTNAAVSKCTATGGEYGVYARNGSTVAECSATAATVIGITAESGCTVTNCSAYQNSNGISTGLSCTVSNCSVYANTGIGINAGGGCTVSNCSAFQNTGNGISTSSGSTVADSTARSNALDGIFVTSGCTVRGNTCDFNGLADGAGIHATGGDNRIEGNNCTAADRGIDVDFAGNIIIKNTCSGNTTNWDIAIGNAVAPIVIATTNGAAILGNAYAGSLGNTDPNANFTY